MKAKRIISLLICVLMIAAVVPFSSGAESTVIFKTDSRQLNAVVSSLGLLHFDVEVPRGYTMTKYQWYEATKGTGGDYILSDDKLLVADTKPTDCIASASSNVGDTKYYAYKVTYRHDTSNIESYSFDVIAVKSVIGETLYNNTPSFCGLGYKWTNDSGECVLTLDYFMVADKVKRNGNVFHFIDCSPTVEVKKVSGINVNRDSAALFFDNSNPKNDSYKTVFKGDSYSVLSVENIGSGAIRLASNRGSFDLDLCEGLKLTLNSAVDAALSGNNSGTVTVKDNAKLSASTKQTSDAISGVKLKLEGSNGLAKPENAILADGVVKYPDNDNPVNEVVIDEVIVKPTIEKATSGVIYVPTNSTYDIETVATLPETEKGPVKYWWAYDMKDDLKTWSVIGSLSENGGKLTVDFGENEVRKAYRCEVWNDNKGDSVVYTDPVIFYSVNNPFKDVKANQWYTSGALYCYKNGFISGTDDESFSPNQKLTRAMIVQILAKVDGADLDKVEYQGKFTDVKSNNWYAKAVQWAVDNGITKGTSEKAFSPNTAVTREQLATFFMAYAKYKNYDVTERASLDAYSDASKVSKWATEAISWAVAEGLISGTSATTLSPKTTATRAQAAVIFKNFVTVYVEKQK